MSREPSAEPSGPAPMSAAPSAQPSVDPTQDDPIEYGPTAAPLADEDTAAIVLSPKLIAELRQSLVAHGNACKTTPVTGGLLAAMGTLVC